MQLTNIENLPIRDATVDNRSSYRIIQADSLKSLEKKVKESMRTGWHPTGGLIVHAIMSEGDNFDKWLYAQAMVWEK